MPVFRASHNCTYNQLSPTLWKNHFRVFQITIYRGILQVGNRLNTMNKPFYLNHPNIIQSLSHKKVALNIEFSPLSYYIISRQFNKATT